MWSKQEAAQVRQALTRAIGAAAADKAIDVLRELRFFSFSDPDAYPFLTAGARVLVCIAEYPGITQREIAIRTGTTESNVAQHISNLFQEGLLTREQVQRRNVYSVDVEAFLGHPDVARFGIVLSDFILKQWRQQSAG